MGKAGLKQFPEFINGESGILDDSTHGKGINGIISWYHHETRSITKNDMAALPDDLEACLFQASNGLLMINACNFGMN